MHEHVLRVQTAVQPSTQLWRTGLVEVVLVTLEVEIVEIRTTQIMAIQEVIVAAVATTIITEAGEEARIEDLVGATEETVARGRVILHRQVVVIAA